MIDWNTLLIQNTSLFTASIPQCLLSCLMATSLSLLFSILVASFGYPVARLFQEKKPSLILSITYALSVVTLCGYFAYRLQFSVSSLFHIFLFISAVLATIGTGYFFSYHRQSAKRFLVEQILPLGLGFFILFLFNTLVTHAYVVATSGGGNNDLYYWAYNAGELLHQVQIANILPLKLEWPSFPMIDGGGTSLLMGYFAVFYHSTPLEISSLFVVGFMGWISLIMSELVMQLYPLKRSTAFIITMTTSCGAFFRYIVYQHFTAQLCATFVFLMLLTTMIRDEQNSPKSSYLAHAWRLSPLLMLLTFVYQAAFIPFFGALLVCMCVFIWQTSSQKEVLKKVMSLLLTLAGSIILSILYHPENARYLLHRMLESAIAINGWPLAFLHVFYLFSLPFPFSLDRGQNTWEYYDLIAIGSVFFGLAVLFVLTQKSKKTLGASKAATVNAASYCFASMTLVYLLAFIVKGHTYQVWKLASYIVMPISFVPLSITTLYCQNVIIQKKHSVSTWLPYISSIILTIIFYCLIVSAKQAGNLSVGGLIQNFEHISSKLKHETATIVLDLPPFSTTMAAFNLLSLKHELLPLSPTYLPEAELSAAQLKNGVTWITSMPCINLLQGSKNTLTNKPIHSLDLYGVLKTKHIIGGYLFRETNPACLLGRQIHPMPDEDGRPVVELSQINLPKNAQLKLRFQLLIPPIFHFYRHNEPVSISVNHRHIKANIDQEGAIIFTLNQTDLQHWPIKMTFDLPNRLQRKQYKTNLYSHEISWANIVFDRMTMRLI